MEVDKGRAKRNFTSEPKPKTPETGKRRKVSSSKTNKEDEDHTDLDFSRKNCRSRKSESPAPIALRVKKRKRSCVEKEKTKNKEKSSKKKDDSRVEKKKTSKNESSGLLQGTVLAEKKGKAAKSEPVNFYDPIFENLVKGKVVYIGPKSCRNDDEDGNSTVIFYKPEMVTSTPKTKRKEVEEELETQEVSEFSDLLNKISSLMRSLHESRKHILMLEKGMADDPELAELYNPLIEKKMEKDQKDVAEFNSLILKGFVGMILAYKEASNVYHLISRKSGLTVEEVQQVLERCSKLPSLVATTTKTVEKQVLLQVSKPPVPENLVPSPIPAPVPLPVNRPLETDPEVQTKYMRKSQNNQSKASGWSSDDVKSARMDPERFEILSRLSELLPQESASSTINLDCFKSEDVDVETVETEPSEMAQGPESEAQDAFRRRFSSRKVAQSASSSPGDETVDCCIKSEEVDVKIENTENQVPGCKTETEIRKIFNLHTICAENKCTKMGTKICTGCERVLYCSRECQALHWDKKHSKQCRQLLLEAQER